MFTKETYINYFKEIQKIEKKMLSSMDELLGMIEDPAVVEIINSIKKDESTHIALEDNLIKKILEDRI